MKQVSMRGATEVKDTPLIKCLGENNSVLNVRTNALLNLRCRCKAPSLPNFVTDSRAFKKLRLIYVFWANSDWKFFKKSSPNFLSVYFTVIKFCNPSQHHWHRCDFWFDGFFRTCLPSQLFRTLGLREIVKNFPKKAPGQNIIENYFIIVFNGNDIYGLCTRWLIR